MARVRASGCFVVACLLSCIPPGYGQGGTAPSEQATLRVSARLVEVTVVVETKKGEPVRDLTREDFKLSDEGREEPIRVFVSGTAPSPGTALPPLPPNTFSNELKHSDSPDSNATVILFDGLNTRIEDQAYARQQITKFLALLKPQDRVGLYVMGRGPRVLQEITGDSESLLRAISGYKGELNRTMEIPLQDPEMSVPARFEAWLGELSFGLIDYFSRDRAMRTIRMMVAIANHLQRLPGRKNLIWVSGSFPSWIESDSAALGRRSVLDRQDLTPDIERAARALNSANLAIYPVDARGLIAPQEYSPDRAVIRIQTGWPNSATLRTMQILAERTGGRAFYNNNDLRSALRQATDDGSASYLLGYYPSHNSWNGKFREIKVKVARPGIQLRYRRGYFAQPDIPSDSEYREADLDVAMWSPLDATRLGLTVRVTPSGRDLDFDLQVDPHDIAFLAAGDAWECGLDFWLVQFGSKDAHLKTTGRTASLRFGQSDYHRIIQSKALPLTEHLALQPGAMMVRVLVRDIRSGALGSISIPLRQVVSMQ